MSARQSKVSGGLRTCSACSGDYEDPERTAESEEAEEDEEEIKNANHDAGLERIPVRRATQERRSDDA